MSSQHKQHEKKQNKRSAKRKHPFAACVKKMLKEQNVQYVHIQVVCNLIWAAENMLVELLRNALYYSKKCKDDEPKSFEKYVQLSIESRYQDNFSPPNEDALIDVAVAVNGNPLVIKEHEGLALPKYHLGNVNYRLAFAKKEPVISQQRFPFYVPLDRFRRNTSNTANHYLYKNPLQIRNLSGLSKRFMLASHAPQRVNSSNNKRIHLQNSLLRFV